MSKEEKNKGILHEPEEGLLEKVIKWYNKQEKLINVIFTCVLVIILAILFYTMYWAPKRQAKAEMAIYKAEQYFATDSIQMALNGDGTCEGLLDVIKTYPCTKTADRARFMAGSCYMKEGRLDDAISMLKKCSTKSKLVSVQALGLIGDAYWEKNNLESAAKYYKKAYKKNPNDLLTSVYLLRYAMVCEAQGNWAQAIKAYETIQKEYTQSFEAMDVEKRIEYAKTRL
ncbi:MAG: tetratricopeptide repeat protein [Bacteroidales bacterium]|nr:tetratricopeptide repeat protein [Bacteroidales bacterium]